MNFKTETAEVKIEVLSRILDIELRFIYPRSLCKNTDGENWSLARSGRMPVEMMYLTGVGMA